MQGESCVRRSAALAPDVSRALGWVGVGVFGRGVLTMIRDQGCLRFTSLPTQSATCPAALGGRSGEPTLRRVLGPLRDAASHMPRNAVGNHAVKCGEQQRVDHAVAGAAPEDLKRKVRAVGSGRAGVGAKYLRSRPACPGRAHLRGTDRRHALPAPSRALPPRNRLSAGDLLWRDCGPTWCSRNPRRAAFVRCPLAVSADRTHAAVITSDGSSHVILTTLRW